MTSIIYACTINSVPVYVGSAYDYRFESRQSEHFAGKSWLQNIDKSSVEFIQLEICGDSERFEREGAHIDQLLIEGFILFNKRDPRLRRKFFSTKESAIKVVESMRRNGTISNGGKAGKGRKQTQEAIKARMTGLMNSPNRERNALKKSQSLKSSEKYAEFVRTKLSGVPKSDSHKRAIGNASREWRAEVKDIMIKFSCGYKEACKIRKEKS